MKKQTLVCFDQIFTKNKVQNQQLELMKVLEYEEIMGKTEIRLKELIEKHCLLYEQFTYSAIKIEHI